MDPRLLRYYNRELQHVREVGAEFAKEFPKIAGRLGLEGLECADPYVERLLEGFGFLAARVQLKVDAEFPRFTQNLLEMIYPHYLAPTPSMAVVRFQPDLSEGSLANGFVIPRHSILRSHLGEGGQAACEYRTAHETELWPIQIKEAEYFSYLGELGKPGLPHVQGAKAGIRLRLQANAGLTFNQISLQKLSLHLRGSDELPMQIYERILANGVALVVMPADKKASGYEVLDRSHIQRVGFEDDQALLPYSQRSFSGYRLLQEYFAFPSRYMFVEFSGIGSAVQRCRDSEIDVVILLNRSDSDLEKLVSKDNFALFCSPAINLFSKRMDRIHLTDTKHEYHAVPDRSRPMDFEVYQVKRVVGFGTSADQEQEFLPFYAANDLGTESDLNAYYAVQRIPRLLSSRQRRQGARSSYLGSEAYVSLVDASEAPYRTELRQLSVETLCTNRDLPLHMPVGQGETDFSMEMSAPVESVRCVAGPTAPKPSFVEGETAWRLINHLSLNYLSLAGSSHNEGAAALRDLMTLYGDTSEAAIKKQVEGLKSITTQAITRRIPLAGPITFGRGLEVSVTFNESDFEGSGVFLLGAVLEQFFSKFVSINSFTETVIRSHDRGEIIRWPARIGRRQTL
ncbi:MAG: type VI secretion system baseplate subunit TssF [Gammaproteobacteria bacterium]|nr:type VI secretion system baseplate subunit TssF [Gammaproteobacteria bacterium]MCF6363371.1 type VI secretion system baseplate subunit TssF [Gammaproteobacteria bacterium]